MVSSLKYQKSNKDNKQLRDSLIWKFLNKPKNVLYFVVILFYHLFFFLQFLLLFTKDIHGLFVRV